ncbi:MAG: hypothetical protein PVS3B3_33470 [Ktedonobacteraceae bacterium]
MTKTQLFISETKPSAELIHPIENIAHIKPKGGIWTSTWNEETRSSGWTEWCEMEEYCDTSKFQWWLLTPLEDLRIYTVDTHKDLRLLGKKYQIPHDYAFWLDYEQVTQDYDAIHLTERGQWATRLTYPISLYGWDCESTLWFRWCFSEVKQINV